MALTTATAACTGRQQEATAAANPSAADAPIPDTASLVASPWWRMVASPDLQVAQCGCTDGIGGIRRRGQVVQFLIA